jgi:hypothetical protein
MNEHSGVMSLSFPTLEKLLAPSGEDPASRFDVFRKAGVVQATGGTEKISILDYANWAECKLQALSDIAKPPHSELTVDQFLINLNSYLNACWKIIPDYVLFGEYIIDIAKNTRDFNELKSIGQNSMQFFKSFKVVVGHLHEVLDFSLRPLYAYSLAIINEDHSQLKRANQIQTVRFSKKHGLLVSTDDFCRLRGKDPDDVSNWKKYLRLIDAIEIIDNTEYVIVSKVTRYAEDHFAFLDSAPAIILNRETLDLSLLACRKLIDDLRHYIKIFVDTVQSGKSPLTPSATGEGFKALIDDIDRIFFQLIDTHRTYMDVLAFEICLPKEAKNINGPNSALSYQ